MGRDDAQLVYTEIDGDVYIVASNFGGERHPAWSYALNASPDAFMQRGGERVAIRAAQLDEDEKASVWPALCDDIPNYAKDRERTNRSFQVYRLDPREQAGAA